MLVSRRLVLPLLVVPALLAADSSKAGLDGQRLALIPARLKQLVDKQEIAGAVSLVARHGVIATQEAVGWQDVEARKPMRTDTIFQIMSMTKPVTAVGLMMLVDEGKVGLLDPVEKYLPEFRGQMMVVSQNADGTVTLRKPARPITVRDCLTHTSGLPYLPPEGLKELNTRMHLPLSEVMQAVSQMPLLYEPGTKWSYSNMGIAVLGRIMEVVADQPYERFLAERLFQPLGMKDSFFFPPAEKAARIAAVYKVEPGKPLVKEGGTILGGDALQYRKGARYPAPEWGLYSTASDLAAFYQMLLNGGTAGGRRYLSKAALQTMTEVHTGDIKAGFLGGTGYGLAVEVVKDPAAEAYLLSPGTYGHGGAFGTQGWIDPKRDMITILLIQKTGGNNDARNALWSIAASAVTE